MLRESTGTSQKTRKNLPILLAAVLCAAVLGVQTTLAGYCEEADHQRNSCIDQCSTSPYYSQCVAECIDFIGGEYPSCSDDHGKTPIDYDTEPIWAPG